MHAPYTRRAPSSLIHTFSHLPAQDITAIDTPSQHRLDSISRILTVRLHLTHPLYTLCTAPGLPLYAYTIPSTLNFHAIYRPSQGVRYNIPVIIWLPERYPMHAPLVYVTPTPNMVIKHNHSCVDASGQVGAAAVAESVPARLSWYC